MSIENKLKKNFDLTACNTFRLAVRAEYFVSVENKRELADALAWARDRRLPFFILAGGSNIILTRKKIKGLAIKITGQDFIIRKNILSSWSGTSLAALVKHSADAGLAGLEWASGIPGSVGGAIRGNAGANGGQIAQNLRSVQVYNITAGKFVRLNNRACRFSYRQSIFKQKNNLIIVKAEFRLSKSTTAELKKIIKKNLLNRLAGQPIEPSAGCIFKNLTLSELAAQNPSLAGRLKSAGAIKNGFVSAGYLIDQAGLKNYLSGRAKISQKHANFIVNTGQASPQDVKKLINLIKRKIKNKYKINLLEEVQSY